MESLARGSEFGWEGERGSIGVVRVPLVVEQLRSGLVVLVVELEWRKLPPGLITPEVGSPDL